VTKLAAPHYELARVDAEGTSEFEIVPITQAPLRAHTGRRGFFGSALSAGSVLAITACSSPPPPRPAAPPVPNPPLARPAPKPAAPPAVAAAPKPAPSPPVPSDAMAECTPMLSHLGAVISLAITPDASQLLSASANDAIKLWALPEGKLLRNWPAVRLIGFEMAPDGKQLAVMLEDKKIELLALPSGKTTKTLTSRLSVRSLAFAPDGLTLFAAGPSSAGIEVWALPEGRLAKTIEGPGAGITSLAVSPDGRLLAAGATGIRLHGLPEGELQQHIKTRGAVAALAITPDNRTLIGAGTLVETFSLPDGQADKPLTGLQNGASAVRALPDSEHFATAGSDGVVRIWSVLKGSLVRTLRGHSREVRALSLAADGLTLASGGLDQTVRLTRLESPAVALACLVDAKATPNTAKGSIYTQQNTYGQTITYTLPCGSPIPAGAVCTCNCVPGGYAVPVPAPAPRSGGTYTYCSCNKICVCIPVCQAHRLLDSDPVVGAMARELLLSMGELEFDYMAWAAQTARSAELAAAIEHTMSQIRGGALASSQGWPSVDDCVARLGSADAVVALMAAQTLQLHRCRKRATLAADVARRVDAKLAAAPAMHWRLSRQS
jgi:WD40 repeat protein